MSTYSDPIEVFNAALIRCGETPINANDTSAEAMLFRSAYEPFVRAHLRKHKWSFAQKAELLPYQGTSGNSPRYVYQPSADVILVHRCTVEGIRWPSFELRANKLLTDLQTNDLVVHYTFRAHESAWADDFADGIVQHMQGLIYAGPLGDTVQGSNTMREAASALLDALGRDRNSQAAPPREGRAPLVEAWRGYGRRA